MTDFLRRDCRANAEDRTHRRAGARQSRAGRQAGLERVWKVLTHRPSKASCRAVAIADCDEAAEVARPATNRRRISPAESRPKSTRVVEQWHLADGRRQELRARTGRRRARRNPRPRRRPGADLCRPGTAGRACIIFPAVALPASSFRGQPAPDRPKPPTKPANRHPSGPFRLAALAQ